MRIYKRPGSKIWWCQYKGDRFSLKTTDEKAARLAFAEHQRREADPNYRPPDPTATLGRYLKAYVEQQTEKGRAQGTLDMYDVHVAHLARVLGEHTLLQRDLGAEELDGYLSQRRQEGAKEATIYKEFATLRGALKIARRHRKFPHALDEVMPEISGASPAGKTHILLDDAAKLMAKLPAPRAAIVAFIVATGADWKSVGLAQPGDFEEGSIHVRGTKTDHRDRVIPILEPFAELARVALAGCPFPVWENVRRDLEVACRRAKVTKVTPRDLRRSHGSILRQMGIEPHLIGKMLGHADSRMVERIYGQLPPEALAKLMAKRLPKARKRTGTKTVHRPKLAAEAEQIQANSAAE
jgi:integrase